MSDPSGGGAVLRPSLPGGEAAALRKRFYRRNLLEAMAVAVLLHILVILGFWLVDLLGVRDISDWSGPVLVKIGAPEAPESSKPDPGPLPEAAETPPTEPAEPVETPPEEASVPSEPAPAPPDTSPDSTRPSPPEPLESASAAGAGAAVESPFAEPSQPAAPAPARVRGDEDGNNYFIDFEGTESEVGRAGAYGEIVDYMPLPYELDAAMVDSGKTYRNMTRDDILRHWEKSFDVYIKKRTVPFAHRPEYWSYLVNGLGYDLEDADWRVAATRPVEVEFTVQPSQDAQGAVLTDIRIVGQGSNPEVDNAIVYGLSRWVYFNKADRPIKARITYEFDR